MSRKKSWKARRKVKAREAERKILWVSAAEVEFLIDLLGNSRDAEDHEVLAEQLIQVQWRFKDVGEKLREMHARLNANAFWEEPSALDRRIRSMRKDHKRRMRKFEQEIACLSAEEVRKLLDNERQENR